MLISQSLGGRIFSSRGTIERNSKANKLTSGIWTQVSQALVVRNRFHLNFKTNKLVFPLFLMVLDLTRREFDATLRADKSLKIEAKLGDRRN